MSAPTYINHPLQHPQTFIDTQSMDISAHKISVKVLRLSRPSLQAPDITKHNDDSDDLSAMVPSTNLMLPRSFGSVHVGEMFNCMVSANSPPSNTHPYQITIQASIQLPNSKDHVTIISSDLPESTEVLEPKQSTQRTVQYEPKEAGLHTLTIKLAYKPTNDEGALPITFLKHYQFNATPGLNVKTKLSQLESQNRYTIEAQVENISESVMTLETTKLLPADGWKWEVFGGSQEKSIALMPRDVHQAAFLVSHENEGVTTAPSQPVGLSRFTLSWRREMGEKGFMTTGPLKPPI